MAVERTMSAEFVVILIDGIQPARSSRDGGHHLAGPGAPGVRCSTLLSGDDAVQAREHFLVEVQVSLRHGRNRWSDLHVFEWL